MPAFERLRRQGKTRFLGLTAIGDTTALQQVLGRFCLQHEPLQGAVDAPRAHVRFLDDGSPRVDHEEAEGTVSGVAQAAAQLGLPSWSHGGPSMFFGGVGVALVHADGAMVVAGDARREAATRIV